MTIDSTALDYLLASEALAQLPSGRHDFSDEATLDIQDITTSHARMRRVQKYLTDRGVEVQSDPTLNATAVIIVGLSSSGERALRSWGHTGLVCRDPARSEGYKLDSVIFGANAAIPGQRITKEVLERENILERYEALITQFAMHQQISSSAAISAISFAKALPLEKRFPRVALDSEDGIVLRWENSGTVTLIIIEGGKIHLVSNAESRNAQYLDNIPYGAGAIPPEFLSAIPAM